MKGKWSFCCIVASLGFILLDMYMYDLPGRIRIVGKGLSYRPLAKSHHSYRFWRPQRRQSDCWAKSYRNQPYHTHTRQKMLRLENDQWIRRGVCNINSELTLTSGSKGAIHPIGLTM